MLPFSAWIRRRDGLRDAAEERLRRALNYLVAKMLGVDVLGYLASWRVIH